MPNGDQKKEIVQQLEKALEAGREAKATGEVCVSVKLHQGGIRNAAVTIQRQIV